MGIRRDALLRALGRILRRATIGLGALIVLLYAFGDRLVTGWLARACEERQDQTLANARGDVAEVVTHSCLLGLFDRRSRIRVHQDGSPARTIVRFIPRHAPRLSSVDIDHLLVDLGEIRSLTPQIEGVGPIRITFRYNGAEPSLE